MRSIFHFLKIAGEFVARRDMLCPARMTLSTRASAPYCPTDVIYAFFKTMMSNCVTQSHISVLASQHWLPIHVLKIHEQYINRPTLRNIPLFLEPKMEIDVNVEAHDLLWRSMSLRIKKAYRESYGVARDALVDTRLLRIIEAGYVVKRGKGIELTPAGKELHRKMTTICKKSE